MLAFGPLCVAIAHKFSHPISYGGRLGIMLKSLLAQSEVK